MKGTPDDIIIGAATGTQALDGQYFNYSQTTPYPQDGHGFLAWIEDVELMVENKRLRQWVRFRPWDVQRQAVIEALITKNNGDFKHKIVVFCWPRGEGKTLIVCAITLFFFFNGYSEVITLAGNSRDQSKFTHYDLCKGMIQHTDRLNNIPGLDIKEKHIALKSGPKEIFSYMQAIPTSVGLLPGTTRAVFTELHNLQDTKFFYDLWTSLRNVPNALVLVDTTVARKGHLVHNLWQTYRKGEDPKIYFNHYDDVHHNPEMTQEELNHFKKTLPSSIFSMYFRNRWEDAAGNFFSTNRIKEIEVCGVDGKTGLLPEVPVTVKRLVDLEGKRAAYDKGKIDLSAVNKEISAIEKRLVLVDHFYQLPATPEDLDKLAKMFGISFILGVGLDRAQRLSNNPGRTVMTCVARGLLSEEESIYFVLDIFIPEESTLPVLTSKFLEWSAGYGWIDKVVVEQFAGDDFYDWVSDKALAAEFVSPNFNRQRAIFFHLNNVVENGYLKSPRVPYYADDEGRLYRGFTNKDDVFREELGAFIFEGTEKKGWFGSPEKKMKGGIQDDIVYSLGWAIYATHGEGLTPVPDRLGGNASIEAIVNNDVVGDYK